MVPTNGCAALTWTMRGWMTGKDENRATALSRVFSATVLRELAVRGSSPTLARLIRETGLVPEPNSTRCVGTIFDQAFDLLKQRAHRHEYVYKAAIFQKVLLGIHSLQTASMATEFRVGRCRADVVILNGTGAVYEIKSERDSLRRLECQIDAFSLVFATVNVIVGKNHLREVEARVPDHVGIMTLSDRQQISTFKPAKDDPGRTNAAAIFDAINQKEAGLVLKAAGKTLPDVPNTQRYMALREQFVTLDPETAHRGMVDCLKHTRNLRPLNEVLESVPTSLRAAIISTPMNGREHGRIMRALHAPICEAVAWG